MKEFKFNVTGQDRKRLVGAISEITNSTLNYLGAPTFAYEIGSYHIDQTGTVTGEYDLNLFVGLAERGFEPEIEALEEPAPETETPEEIVPGSETPASNEIFMDDVCIEVPLDGFPPDVFDNLEKLVASKATLIKKALGVEHLHINMLDDRIDFDWFKAADSESVTAYAQFINCLCETAKERKRVTAKPQESFENEKFAMRVWLIGLGMIGKEYTLARKLLIKNLEGNSSWRYGVPEKKGAAAPETPVDGTAPTEEAAAE